MHFPTSDPGVVPIAPSITPVRGFPWSRRRDGTAEPQEATMATYTLVYRDDEGDHEVTETLENVDDVQREDGIVSLWRGNTAFLRLQERHVVSLERA